MAEILCNTTSGEIWNLSCFLTSRNWCCHVHLPLACDIVTKTMSWNVSENGRKKRQK